MRLPIRSALLCEMVATAGGFGNTTKPCKLDIEIEKGKYKLADNLISELLIEINKFKEDIIKIKLDYLFGYISEGDALGKFNVFKEDIQGDTSPLLIQSPFITVIIRQK